MDFLAAIEAYFADARGGGFALSARDVEVALAWESRGIPLDVVLRAMAETDSRRRVKGALEQRPRTLKAYSRAVDKAFALARALGAGAHPRRDTLETDLSGR